MGPGPVTGPAAPRPFRAPDHIVDELAQMMTSWQPSAPAGTVERTMQVRDQARLMLDRWWAEAYAAGVGRAWRWANHPTVLVGASFDDGRRTTGRPGAPDAAGWSPAGL